MTQHSINKNRFFKLFSSEAGLNDKNEILFAQIALVIILVMTVILIDVSFRQNDLFTGNTAQASLLINFENKQRLFEGEVVSGMTILDALQAAAAAGQIKLKYSIGEDNSVEIAEINDHINYTADKAFNFYLNGVRINAKNINQISIQNGDKIEIRFESR